MSTERQYPRMQTGNIPIYLDLLEGYHNKVKDLRSVISNKNREYFETLKQLLDVNTHLIFGLQDLQKIAQDDVLLHLLTRNIQNDLVQFRYLIVHLQDKWMMFKAYLPDYYKPLDKNFLTTVNVTNDVTEMINRLRSAFTYDPIVGTKQPRLADEDVEMDGGYARSVNRRLTAELGTLLSKLEMQY